MFVKEKTNEYPRAQAHMANERTFLAWIRTSIAIMGFGFVVEKFGLFMRKFSAILAAAGGKPEQVTEVETYSSHTGIFLIGIGVFIAVIEFLKYINTERQIKQELYLRSIVLDLLMTAAIIVIAVLFAMHLIHSRI
ncbi:MAG: DUF202 domain-containing protein [Candidatus Magnetominusculus sp. LBB02]|nr:DUF202 domain-containing protein [Candidatus Magnetominusculus sp. LBB02]